MLYDKKVLEQKFSTDYENLNFAQKKAVDTIDGPVLVIAGPGTGKTKILSMRIANILLKTDIYASNILCLTFTKDAAANMKNRLYQLIGAEAFKIAIHTFHSFCNSIIQSHQNYFQVEDFEILSDIERKILYRTLIENLSNQHPLKKTKGELYQHIKYLEDVFDFMQKENLTASILNQHCNKYILSLPTREAYIYIVSNKSKGFAKGDVKKKEIENEVKQVEKFIAAVDLFDTYKIELKKLKRYTFNDMIENIIKCFEEDNFILARYQERFQYVLVDEFQDTNGSQNKIIETLLSFWENNNLFVVGDEDQCIFRFQGAQVQNISNFYNRYKNNINSITLTQNYRSSQAILNIAMNLIHYNEGRLSNIVDGIEEKKLISLDKNQATNILPIISHYANEMQEAVGISECIKMYINEGYAYSDIAILYAKNNTGVQLSQVLQSQNIPFQISKTLNLLDENFVKNLIKIIRYVCIEHQTPFASNEYLFEILHYNIFNNNAFDIADAVVKMKQFENTIHRYSLRYYLNINSENAKNINGNDVLENVINQYGNYSLSDYFLLILNECKILDWIMLQSNKIWLMELVTNFHDLILLENKKNPQLTLVNFLNDFIDVCYKENIVASIEQKMGTNDGVKLKTCHAAKGEEYNIVMMTKCTKKEWELSRNIQKIKIPDTVFDYETTEESALYLEEKRRLFYVGITRAKKHLHLCYASSDDNQDLSQFVLEASNGLDTQLINYKYEKPLENILLTYKLEAYKKKQILEFNKYSIIDSEKSNIVLSAFTLSASTLDAYLNCPVGFYFTKILKVPTNTNVNIVFGNVLHYVLEFAYKNMLGDIEQNFPNIENCLNIFNKQLEKFKFLLNDYENEVYKVYGTSLIKKVHEIYLVQSEKNVIIENSFKENISNDLYLSGRIDKIELSNDSAIIVDYKTGKFDAKDWIKPNKRNEFGGKHWRQAIVYALLLDRQKKFNLNNPSFQFVYLNENKNNVNKTFDIYQIQASKADKEFVLNILKTVWTKIKNHEFANGCNDCSWCNLVKEKLYI